MYQITTTAAATQTIMYLLLINLRITFNYIAKRDLLKSTIDSALENYDQKLVTIKRKKGTNYYIESNNSEISKEDHKNIINKLQENAKINKIKFNLIN